MVLFYRAYTLDWFWFTSGLLWGVTFFGGDRTDVFKLWLLAEWFLPHRVCHHHLVHRQIPQQQQQQQQHFDTGGDQWNLFQPVCGGRNENITFIPFIISKYHFCSLTSFLKMMRIIWIICSVSYTSYLWPSFQSQFCSASTDRFITNYPLRPLLIWEGEEPHKFSPQSHT